MKNALRITAVILAVISVFSPIASALTPAASAITPGEAAVSEAAVDPDGDFTVTYNVNTDDPAVITPAPQECNRGNNWLAIIAPAPVREGYEFVEWNTSKTGSGLSQEPGEALYLHANLTLHAIWREAEPSEPVSGDDADEPVAIIYLCVSGPHAHYFFGHTWICIRNISSGTITVDGTDIQPGEMASFGLHHDGGLHINRELNRYRGETVTAKQASLTSSQLSDAEGEITSSRWSWYELFAHNCTNFATSVWAMVTGVNYVAFCFPFIVQMQMALSGTDSLVIGN